MFTSSIKVEAHLLGEGQPDQYYILCNKRTKDVVHYAPNKWKTEKGALTWAKNHGYRI